MNQQTVEAAAATQIGSERVKVRTALFWWLQAFLTGLGTMWWIHTLSPLFPWNGPMRWLSHPVWRLLAIVCLLIGGIILFLFREFRREEYGQMEMSIGLVVGWDALGKIAASGLANWTALAAAAFLIVRGLDNARLISRSKDGEYLSIDFPWPIKKIVTPFIRRSRQRALNRSVKIIAGRDQETGEHRYVAIPPKDRLAREPKTDGDSD
jgi:hypothetical protein